MTISEEAVKAMPERIYAVKRTEGSNCVVSFDTPSLDYNVEYVRADLAPFLPVQGAVKKLEWRKGRAGTPFGPYHVIEETNDDEPFWFVMFNGKAASRCGTHDDEESAIFAAQADYEARILSALEPSAGRAAVLEDAALSESVNSYAANYEFRGDSGDYTPTDGERVMIEDAIEGFLSNFLSALEPAAARELAMEEAAQVAGNFLMLKTGLPVDKIVELEAALRALSSQPVADGVDSIEATRQDDGLTACFRHHVKTSIGWQAFGARTGKERQMYEEGFKAGYRRCKSDNEPELGEDEYISQRARMIVGRLRESIKAGAVNLSDVEDAADLILDQDTRASHPVVERLPQDVINLVIAAREFWEDHYSDLPSSHVLDEALEAFSNSVLCKNEPAALPASPGASATHPSGGDRHGE